MTNRLSLKPQWAQDGVRDDPDLDTTHPIFIANRYEGVGWKEEKPPEEWQNFLSNLTEAQLYYILTNGIPIWDVKTTYLKGAVVCSAAGGNIYINVTNGTLLGKDPATTPASWGIILGLTSSGFDAFVKEFKDSLTAHMTPPNPHNDTIEKAGGVKQDYVDKGFGDVTDARTIGYHTARTGRVHSETPAQVGTLPTTGGVFTGDVHFLDKIILNVATPGVVDADHTHATTRLSLANYSLHVDATGKGWAALPDGSPWQLIVSEANFADIQSSLNVKFALPLPEFWFHLEHSMSDVLSIGKWTITSAAEPVFEPGLGLRFDNNNLTTSSFGYSQATNITALFVGSVGNVPFSLVIDTGMGNIGGFSNFLNNLKTGSTNIKELRIYRRLSALQKTKLVVY